MSENTVKVGDTLHVLTIENKYGTLSWPCRTAEGAKRRLVGYVHEMWERMEGTPGIPADPPEDDDEAIRIYFGEMQDDHREISTTMLSD